MAELEKATIAGIDAGLARWYEHCGQREKYKTENEDGDMMGIFSAKCEEC